MYSGVRPFMKDAMRLFAEKRSSTKKGVTQPSQLRYINYFNMIISRKVKMTVRKLLISEIVIGPLPQDTKVCINISTYSDSYDSKQAFSSTPDVARVEQLNGNEVRVVVPVGIVVSRDFLLVARHKSGKELFHISLNTCFIDNYDHTETFCRKELDCFDKSIPFDTIVMLKVNKTTDTEELDEAFMARVLEMQKIYSERVTRKLMEENKTAFETSRRLKTTIFAEASSSSSSSMSSPSSTSSPSTRDHSVKSMTETSSSIIIGKEKLIAKEQQQQQQEQQLKEKKEKEGKRNKLEQVRTEQESVNKTMDGDTIGRVRMMIRNIEDGNNRNNGHDRRENVKNDGRVKKLIEELEKPKEYVSSQKSIDISGDVCVRKMVHKIEAENEKKIEMQIQKVRIRESMMVTPEQVRGVQEPDKEEFEWIKNVRISGADERTLNNSRYSFQIHIDTVDDFGVPGDDEFDIISDDDSDSDYDSEDENEEENEEDKEEEEEIQIQIKRPVCINIDKEDKNDEEKKDNLIMEHEKVSEEEKSVIADEKKEEEKLIIVEDKKEENLIIIEEKKEEEKIIEIDGGEEKSIVIGEEKEKTIIEEEKSIVTEKPIDVVQEENVEVEKPVVEQQNEIQQQQQQQQPEPNLQQLQSQSPSLLKIKSQIKLQLPPPPPPPPSSTTQPEPQQEDLKNEQPPKTDTNDKLNDISPSHTPTDQKVATAELTRESSQKPSDESSMAPKDEEKRMEVVPPQKPQPTSTPKQQESGKPSSDRPAIIIGVNKILYKRMLDSQKMGQSPQSSQSSQSFQSMSQTTGHTNSSVRTSPSPPPPPSPPLTHDTGRPNWTQGTKPKQRTDNAFTFFRK